MHAAMLYTIPTNFHTNFSDYLSHFVCFVYVPQKLQHQQQQQTAAHSISIAVNVAFCFVFVYVQHEGHRMQLAIYLLTRVCVCVCIIVATFVYAPIAESNMWAAWLCVCCSYTRAKEVGFTACCGTYQLLHQLSLAATSTVNVTAATKATATCHTTLS